MISVAMSVSPGAHRRCPPLEDIPLRDINGYDDDVEKDVHSEEACVDEPDTAYLPSPTPTQRVSFNHNLYATKKTIASSLLDLALLSANASQLKVCVQSGPQNQEFYYFLVSMISMSIILQIVTAVLFIVIGKRDIHDHDDDDEEHNKKNKTNRINDIATAFVFLITVINVFICGFGVSGHPRSRPFHTGYAPAQPGPALNTNHADALKPN